MINSTDDRHLFIGGSEANYIYMNYETESFKNWWEQKLTGVNPPAFTNINMAIGTILEHDIIDLYERINNVKGIREDTRIKRIARANTDYLLGDIVKDVKCTKQAEKWFKKGSVPIKYKRQLIHYCFVYDLRKSSIIAYQCDEKLLENPFTELDPEKLFEIEVPITDADIQKHEKLIKHLEACKELGVYP